MLPSTAENPAPSNDCPVVPQPGANPYLFIVGCPRSGTTMLKRMLAAHPLIAITRETHWVARFYERRRGLDDNHRVTPSILEKWYEYHRFSHLGIKLERLARILEKNPGDSYSDFVSRLYDRYGERKGKPIVGDKTPSYARKIPILTTLWPRTRIVHLIRDGRDVWLSVRNWRMTAKSAGSFTTWATDAVMTTAFWWKALVGMGCQDGASLEAGRYQSIHYESLVSDAEQQCRELAEFLAISYHPKMPRYYEGRTDQEKRGSANQTWLPPTPGLRDWRTQMDRADLERFEAAAGDLLQQLGYELGCTKISVAVRRQADRVKQAFTVEALGRRGWRLPDHW